MTDYTALWINSMAAERHWTTMDLVCYWNSNAIRFYQGTKSSSCLVLCNTTTKQWTHLEDNVSVPLVTKQSFPCYKSHNSAWQIHYFLLCLLCYSPFTHATHPSSKSCSRFSATLVRNSGVHTSWLYERLNCFRVGHLRHGSKAKEGPMSFREISRCAIQFIFNK